MALTAQKEKTIKSMAVICVCSEKEREIFLRDSEFLIE